MEQSFDQAISTKSSPIDELARQALARNRCVVTHLMVDLDAVMSVAAYAHLIGRRVKDLAISFVPAGIDKAPSGMVGLDITAGYKGLPFSAFEGVVSLMPLEDRQALRNLVSHVTRHDRGDFYKLEDASLAIGTIGTMIKLLRSSGSSDLEMVELGERIFLSHLSAGRLRVAAERTFEREAQWYGKVVLLPKDRKGPHSSIAYEKGAELVVYQDGHNLGVAARAGSKFHLGKLLEGKIPEGFFVHPEGFLVAWGTKKSPAQTPAPISAEALATLVAEQIKGG